jgi:tripartite-type tricarboxylate transporter receptor subunit TctC
MKTPKTGAWIGATVAAALAFASGATAQTYPAKPIRMVVGFAPGGGTDVTARLVAQRLTPLLGQSVVVENRPGVSGAIAAENVARAAPDGYTVLMIASTTLIYASLRSNPPFNIERDLAPVSFVTSAPLLLVVHPSVPARNVQDLIRLAQARSGQMTFGSDGIGGTTHLAGELFNIMAKVKLVHVPFKGGSESAVALAGGQIDTNLPSLPSALPLLKAGKFRPLAVTHARRSTLIPDIPTLDESGLTGFDLGTWFGLLTPAAAPREIIRQLNAAVLKAVNTPDMTEAINRQGMEPQTSTPEQFAAFMRTQREQIVRIGKSTDIRLD